MTRPHLQAPSWSVRLIRGPLPDRWWHNQPIARAWARAKALAYLHSAQIDVDDTASTLTVDATEYYEDRP